MRMRSLLLLPALTVAPLALGAAGASAATLFTSTSHTTRVTVGATWDATAAIPLDLTVAPGLVFLSCPSSLSGIVGSNNMTVGVTLEVRRATFLCSTLATVATAFPWTLTIAGSSTVIGANTTYRAAFDRFSFDMDNIGSFQGDLSTGVTALQPNSGTSPITVNLANAGDWTAGSAILTLRLDGSYQLTGTAAGWSLTN